MRERKRERWEKRERDRERERVGGGGRVEETSEKEKIGKKMEKENIRG